MNKQAADTTALPRWMRAWERFWFSPMDPTPLALIRILCGMIVLYTIVAHSFALEDMMGPDAWLSLGLRQEIQRNRPTSVMSLRGAPLPIPARTPEQHKYLDDFRLLTGKDLRMYGLAPPENAQQWKYLLAYYAEHKDPPPAYAESDRDANYVEDFIKRHRFDPRINGLRLPQSAWEKNYLEEYARMWRVPPPAYAADEEEAQKINEYREREFVDPRMLYSRGTPIWSIWMHVTDPTGMGIVQGCCILFALLFTLGLGTRVTAVLTWLASISYVHRNVMVMFGVDTMTNILLIYLMIGPSGAALSLDRLIARWWRGERGTPAAPPAPRVSANFAIRLMQLHICIIYLIAGVSKLQGTAWWNGTALWSVLANFEFAPMHIGLYNDLLRFVARDQFWLEMLLTGGCYFTLFFEIGYAFLVWFPRMRWVFLAGAIFLHGMIGMVMGLKTFSFVMLVMNMCFLRPEEVHWLLGWFRRPSARRAPVAPALETVASVGATTSKK
jgi:hypothetical protein